MDDGDFGDFGDFGCSWIALHAFTWDMMMVVGCEFARIRKGGRSSTGTSAK